MLQQLYANFNIKFRLYILNDFASVHVTKLLFYQMKNADILFTNIENYVGSAEIDLTTRSNANFNGNMQCGVGKH